MKDSLGFNIEEATKLCQELPVIADRLMRAGLIQTAHRMQEAIRSAGYEAADLREGKRQPVERRGRRINWREP